MTRPASESRPDPRQCSNVEYNKHDVQVSMSLTGLLKSKLKTVMFWFYWDFKNEIELSPKSLVLFYVLRAFSIYIL